MKKDWIGKLHVAVEYVFQHHVATVTEFWQARELQTLLDHARWKTVEHFDNELGRIRDSLYE